MKLIKRNNMAGIPSIFDDFFKDDFFRFPSVEREWGGTVPSVNIRETEESFELEVAAPGLKKEDFQLNLDHDVLTISSEKKDAEEVKEGNWKKRG
ncbi:MAG: Hsp20/alpha crystallin family protein, partial [Saprospiraceae bacterium]